MASTASSVSASPVQGVPGTTVDPWTIQPRERARYEEQFKALRPSNGIVTGDQAKGFMLQSQLPPLVLGQIWSLSDTDADGKMDINEFSIACKLINLKLRGFEIPKALPASLISSVKNTHVPPTIPPLPGQLLNMNIQNTSTVPVRPHPPKPSPPLITNTPLITTQMQSQPLISNLIGQASTTNMAPLSQTNNSNLIQPLASNTNNSAPLIPNVQQNLVQQSTVPNLSQNMPVISQPLPQSQPIPVPGISSSVSGLIQPLGSNMPSNIQNIIPSLSQVIPGSIVYTSPVVPTSTPGSGGPPVISSATGTPQSRSIDRIASLDSPAQLEWSVPHQTKLKFTQLFNTTDRTRTGYLSGVQARNLMLQSKLPQSILAQIWALSDMDSDGRLGCDEFVLAMHLCEQATMGKLPPAVLPPDMVPPAFRRGSITSSTGIPITGMSRHGSISSQGSQPTEMDPAASLLQTTFEDKRKENFEKGQAELERRRRALLEAQRAEAEARERKEREEQERRERAKAEQEKRRQQELQQQLQEQLEKERQLEEERKRQQEQRDAARREMERQRQLEWEKQRSQELQQQRQRAQENVLRLKARNQSLTIELNTLTDQVKELSQKICDTRVGVSNVKTTIDGMRVTRDTHMQELSQLKNKLKDQNARLIALSQEKAKLDTKNKINSQLNDQFLEQTQAAYDNKEVAIKNLKEKLSDMEKQIHGKMNDIENNNSQLTELTNQLTDLVSECENLYCAYEEKKNKVLEMKGLNRTSSLDYTSGWKDDSAWDTATNNDWSVENTTVNDNSSNVAGMIRYRALYEFVARNQDEISFQPGDIILVPQEQNGEPGWLAGEIRGHVGWFPQSYVEQMDTVASEPQTTDSTLTSTVDSSLSTAFDDGFAVSKTLEGIAEVPETLSENSHSADTVIAGDISAPTVLSESESEPEFYVACYAYQSIEQGDLSFNAGDLITVVKKDGDWWTGKIGENIGIFPSNYVQKSETNGTVTNGIDNTNNLPASVPDIKPIEEVKQDNVQSSNDAEISAIIEKRHSKVLEKSPDFAAMASNTQTMKSSKKPEIASVIAPYQATSPEQLTLARGQLIMIRKKSESGWWEGELQAKGRRRQVGWFPATYVKILESSGRNSGRNTPVSASKTDQQEMILDKVIALFPYTAQNADELTFAKDDIISVTGRDEQAWWRGELNGVSGLFPSNYVGPLQ